ncbi:hypothetical protein LCGC14_2194270 [marine sediment metagenome]|uniref:Uncharacterized protein n=1 Tax=marine sediment metagenome TaxID=412755 RepID=A0A0F9DIM8_9ZZZZ
MTEPYTLEELEGFKKLQDFLVDCGTGPGLDFARLLRRFLAAIDARDSIIAASRALVEVKDKGLDEGKWWLEHWGERYAEVPRGPVRTALAKILGCRARTEADFMEAEERQTVPIPPEPPHPSDPLEPSIRDISYLVKRARYPRH